MNITKGEGLTTLIVSPSISKPTPRQRHPSKTGCFCRNGVKLDLSRLGRVIRNGPQYI